MAVANGLLLYPIRFSATSYVVRVTTNATTENLTFPSSGSLTTTRNYWMSGDDQADGDGGVGGIGDLVAMLEATLNTNSAGRTYTVTLSATNIITVAVNSGTFQILWSHASTTLDETIFGFASGVDTSAATSTTAPNQTQGVWAPERPIAIDSRDRQPVVGGVMPAISGLSRTARMATPKAERDVSFTLLPQSKALREYEDADEPTGSFEEAWLSGISLGRPVRLYTDASSRTSTSYALYRTRDLDDPLKRSEQYLVRWQVDLRLRRAD